MYSMVAKIKKLTFDFDELLDIAGDTYREALEIDIKNMTDAAEKKYKESLKQDLVEFLKNRNEKLKQNKIWSELNGLE